MMLPFENDSLGASSGILEIVTIGKPQLVCFQN